MNKLFERLLPTKSQRIAAKFIRHHNQKLTAKDKCKNAGLSDRDTNHVLEMCEKYGCRLEGMLDIYRRYGSRPLSDYVVEEEE